MPRLNVRTDRRHRIPKSMAEDDNAGVPILKLTYKLSVPLTGTEVTRTAEFEVDKPRCARRSVVRIPFDVTDLPPGTTGDIRRSRRALPPTVMIECARNISRLRRGTDRDIRCTLVFR